MKNNKKLSSEQSEALLKVLQSRFEKNMNRHKGLDWEKIQSKLEKSPEKLWSLNEMEETEGEPDVINYDKKTHPKVQNVEVFVTIIKPGKQEKPTNPKIMLLTKP